MNIYIKNITIVLFIACTVGLLQAKADDVYSITQYCHEQGYRDSFITHHLKDSMYPEYADCEDTTHPIFHCCASKKGKCYWTETQVTCTTNSINCDKNSGVFEPFPK